MGLAASQARFLGITARKSNIEYEGQQVNQQRTALAEEVNALYNKLLSLKLPIAPDTTEFYKSNYSFSVTDSSSDETGDYIELTLGEQVSSNTSFYENNVNSVSKSLVGSIPTWERIWGPDDAEAWAKDCCCNPEDYDPDEEVTNEVNMWYNEGKFDEDIEEIKKNIIEFAKYEGYDEVEF